jgi:hypothetical protein
MTDQRKMGGPTIYVRCRVCAFDCRLDLIEHSGRCTSCGARLEPEAKEFPVIDAELLNFARVLRDRLEAHAFDNAKLEAFLRAFLQGLPGFCRGQGATRLTINEGGETQIELALGGRAREAVLEAVCADLLGMRAQPTERPRLVAANEPRE